MRLILISAAAAALSLTACGASDAPRPTDTTATDIARDAAASVAGSVTGLGVTPDLPAFVEVPPGSKAINAMNFTNDGKTGGTVTFETSQKPADLAAFYKASMPKNGLKIGMENRSDQIFQLLGESEDKSKTLMVVVTVDETGKALLNLTHGRDAR